MWWSNTNTHEFFVSIYISYVEISYANYSKIIFSTVRTNNALQWCRNVCTLTARYSIYPHALKITFSLLPNWGLCRSQWLPSLSLFVMMLVLWVHLHVPLPHVVAFGFWISTYFGKFLKLCMWMDKESKELLPSFFQISLKVLTQQNSLEQWKMIRPNVPWRIKVFLPCCNFLHRLNWRPKHPTTPSPKFATICPNTYIDDFATIGNVDQLCVLTNGIAQTFLLKIMLC